MAILNTEDYQKVVNVGKMAIEALKNDNMKDFYKYSESAWELFPNPKNNWNQGYNFSKMILKNAIIDNNFEQAKKWMNRMIENNNNLHLFDEDCTFEVAKYHFETKNFEEAHKLFKDVVDKAGLRYFEGEDPKYLEFYKNPEKYKK